MKSVYRHADKALKQLYRYAASIFQRAAMLANFDELHVTQTVSDMYSHIYDYAFREFRKIAEQAYQDAIEELLLLLPSADRRRLRGIDDVFILRLLESYDAKTQYRYDHEWERKRDRLTESIIALDRLNAAYRVANSNELRQALDRGLTMVERQMRQMVDTVTDESRNQCYADAGVEYVLWNTQRDGKVCSICRDRDGRQYPLYGVPAKHPHCRCYLTPLLDDVDEEDTD